MMLVEKGGEPIVSVFVLCVHPPQWPDADDTSQLPQVVSFVVKGAHRNQGASTYLIGAVEEEVKSRGYAPLYLGVDHRDTSTRRLYKGLGFEPISAEPYRSAYTETDANRIDHEIVDWLIGMVKKLS